MKELTEHQAAVLEALRFHGAWHKGCPWVYGTMSATRDHLDALEKKGKIISRPFGAQGKIYYSDVEFFRQRHVAGMPS